MSLQSRYVFSAAMDVEPSREAIFNEVEDRWDEAAGLPLDVVA